MRYSTNKIVIIILCGDVQFVQKNKYSTIKMNGPDGSTTNSIIDQSPGHIVVPRYWYYTQVRPEIS